MNGWMKEKKWCHDGKDRCPVVGAREHPIIVSLLPLFRSFLGVIDFSYCNT